MSQDIPYGAARGQIIELIHSVLAQPVTAIAYQAGRQLRQLWPEKGFLECSSCGFDLDGYVEAGQAAITPLADYGHNQMLTAWRGCREDEAQQICATGEEGLSVSPVNAFLRVDWRGQTLETLRLSWSEMMGQQHACFLIGETQSLVEEFYGAVCAWSSVPHGEVLVFEQGSSATMAWFNAGPDASMDPIALVQAQALEVQRRSKPAEGETVPPEPTRADRIRELFDGKG